MLNSNAQSEFGDIASWNFVLIDSSNFEVLNDFKNLKRDTDVTLNRTGIYSCFVLQHHFILK